MCIIIYQPEGAEFKPGLLRNLFQRNSDGFGLFYADEGRIHVEKIVKPNEDSIVETFEKFKDRPLVMHLRLMTHGIQDMENTHPYRILNKRRHGVDLWMAHNGVLDVDEEHVKRSDTWHFVEYFLRPTLANNPALLQNTSFQKILKNAAGSNKLLFLNGKGEVTIINEGLGIQHRDTGCWLSNNHGLNHSLTWYSSSSNKKVKNEVDPYHPDYYEDWDRVNPTGKVKDSEETGFNYVIIRGVRCVWDFVDKKYYPLKKIEDNKSFIYSTHLHKYIESQESDEKKKNQALLPQSSSILPSPIKKMLGFFPINKSSNIIPFVEPSDIPKEKVDSSSQPIPLPPMTEKINGEVFTTCKLKEDGIEEDGIKPFKAGLHEEDFDIWEEEDNDKGPPASHKGLTSNEWDESVEWATYIVENVDTRICNDDLYLMTLEDLLILSETQPENVVDYILTNLYGDQWPSIWLSDENSNKLEQFKKKE